MDLEIQCTLEKKKIKDIPVTEAMGGCEILRFPYFLHRWW
jgi:hypothetical protein